jgi:hypothetical protein
VQGLLEHPDDSARFSECHSVKVYPKGESSPPFTVTPPAGERLGNPEMDNSLFINPWANED